MPERTFPPVTFEEMITHNDLLERYSWLTPQIVNRWRRQGAIRVFKGKEGMSVYPMGDLVKAVSDDLNASIEDTAGGEPTATPPPSGPAPAAQQEMSEADQIRERQFLQGLADRKQRRKKREE
ncbi:MULTISPECIES: hypothetical protein [unclassified Rhizobium]|uniref:hypothetical protein n=1 Tax=unclassified Rhizobium TaxID=2613769 RepID=UPI000BD8B5A4|nr:MULTISPECIES: hypothetical protein [unclassified Rhizobium]MDH7805716.1 hypothetical protein [Rhizobium sp. AN67]MDQ4407191.1 hypothetical protein [Rhizobium sp. AN63]SOD59797.1 hypothetical protein SAMN05216595_4958 [Rhizobium sp. AN6A]